MQTYLVESYWPDVTATVLAEAISRTSALGEDVRWTDSILVLADEIVLSVCTGPSHARVRARLDAAALPFERIVECVRLTEGRHQRSTQQAGVSASRSAT